MHAHTHTCTDVKSFAQMGERRDTEHQDSEILSLLPSEFRGTGLSHAGMDAGLAPAVPGAASLASQTLRGRGRCPSALSR